MGEPERTDRTSVQEKECFSPADESKPPDDFFHEHTVSTQGKSNILLLIIVVVIVSVGSYFYTVAHSEVLILKKVKSGDPLTVLFLFTDEKENLLFSEAFFYNLKTYKSALLDVPMELGGLIKELNRVDLIKTLYSPENPEPYVRKVSRIIDSPIHFYIKISVKNLSNIIDLLGGIDLFISQPVRYKENGVSYRLPAGSIKLDGWKLKTYLDYKPLTYPVKRHQMLMQSLLSSLRSQADLLRKNPALRLLKDNLKTDIKGSSFKTFLSLLKNLEPDRMSFQQITGNTKTIDFKTFLFPYYEGRLLKESVVRLKNRLDQANRDTPTIALTLRILNGTKVRGLARKTAELFRGYGYQVVSIENAERQNYENTVIFDHKGYPDLVKKVASLIRATHVYSRLESEKTTSADITIILGKDFNGRFVQKAN